MTDQPFVFFVSHVRVELRCEHAPALSAMRAVWGGCDRPLIATRQHARFEAVQGDGGYAISSRGGAAPPLERFCAEPLDVLPVLEAALYAAMHEWHAPLLALHAACVGNREATWVLLGRSGAGKSSLARAAVRHGLDYFSDEVVLCDGERLWGVPRAIQFAPLADGDESPPWLGEVDLDSYRFRVGDGREGALPLWMPQRARLAAAPRPLAGARVYALERAAETGVAPLPVLELLAAMHEAAYRPPPFDLGPLVHPDRAGRLSWSDPDRAIAALLRSDA